MNMMELQRKQLQLDEFIITSRKLKISNVELVKNMMLACHDEILECMEAPTDPSEYIDVLHFVLSIANKFDIELDEIPHEHAYEVISFIPNRLQHDLLLITRYSRIFKHWSDKKANSFDKNSIKVLLQDMVDNISGACQLLEVDMLKEYNKKYQINIERQHGDY